MPRWLLVITLVSCGAPLSVGTTADFVLLAGGGAPLEVRAREPQGDDASGPSTLTVYPSQESR